MLHGHFLCWAIITMKQFHVALYRINTATKFQCVRCLFKDALIEIPTLPLLIQYPNIPACSKVSLQILHTVFISQFYLLRLSFHFFLSFRNVERAANSMIHWFSSETFSAIHFFLYVSPRFCCSIFSRSTWIMIKFTSKWISLGNGFKYSVLREGFLWNGFLSSLPP